MTEARTLLSDARELISKVREAHLGGFTLESEIIAEMREFLEESERFV